MRAKLEKVSQVFLSVMGSVEAFVRRRLVNCCVKNCERFYSESPNREDLPQRSMAGFGNFRFRRITRFAWVAILFVTMLGIPTANQAQTQQQAKPAVTDPVPEPAV